MADHLPFGVPVRYLQRFRVIAYRRCEMEVEAETIEQAGAMACFMAQRDGHKLLMVEPIPDAVPEPVADLLADEPALFELPPAGP